MIHPEHTRAAVALVVGLVLVASLPTGVATAQSDDGSDSILGDVLDVEVSGLGDTVDGFLGLVSGGIDRARGAVTGPDRSAAACREDLMAEVNQHSGAYLGELNAKTSPSSTRDVLRVRCIEDPRRPWADTESASFYVVANVSNGTYQSAEAVETTDRTVDHTVVLRRLAREQLADDLAAYRETYIEGDKTVGKAYQRRMTAKYAGSVYGTVGPLPAIPDDYQDLEDTDGGAES
jgi:hypothetical protein